jgi:hypothetical protein
MAPLRIIVSGLIAQHPHMGGVAWDYVQYPAGLLNMGHDVYYIEDSGEWPYNLDGGPSGNDWAAANPTHNLEHLQRTLARFGMADRWAYRFPRDGSWHGLSDHKRKEVIDTADLLLNVSGTLEHPDHYRAASRMAYIDSDPLFTQVKWRQQAPEFAARVDLHDVHFSFGESFSAAMPETNHQWLPTRQPILLDEWANDTSPTRQTYSTVMNWTSYPPVIHEGVHYGQKDIEFRKFLDLPSVVAPAQMEVALAHTEHHNWQSQSSEWPEAARRIIHDTPQISPSDLLTRMGWNVVDPEQCCADIDSYRNYIMHSKAEWSVAKHGYVQASPGWFSCRSSCYLAAGRPVIVEDTGFSRVLPCGKGLLSFSNMEQAVEAIRQVEADYQAHASAARDIAVEFFDANKVLQSLIDRAMQPSAASALT